MGKLDLKAGAKLDTRGSDLFPQRPSYGSTGKQVVLWANYFPIEVTSKVVYKYTLDVKESVTAMSKKKDSEQVSATKDVKGRRLHLAIQAAMDSLSAADKDQRFASQFKTQIVALKKIELDAGVLVVDLPRENVPTEADQISITFHGPIEMRLGDIVSYTQSLRDSNTIAVYPKYPEIMDTLDVILGHTARSRLGEMSGLGPRFFPFRKDTRTASLMQDHHALTAARGFFQSARLATGRLMLNTNITHGVFKMSGKMEDLMKTLSIRAVPRSAEPRQKRLVAAFAKFLPKTRVWATFSVQGGKTVRRTKVIESIVSPLTASLADKDNPCFVDSSFSYPGPKNVSFMLKEENRKITVHQYFKESQSLPRFVSNPYCSVTNSAQSTKWICRAIRS